MKKAKILIAEDQVMIAKTIESELMTSGYEVLATVFSSEDAVCEAGKNKPDLIMMDIKLSGEMDGIQAAEQIRTKYDIPIVFVTTYDDPAILERAKPTNPEGFIQMPFKSREIERTIEIALHQREIKEKLKSSTERLNNTQKIFHPGNWEWNIVTNELHWSDEIYRMFGLTPQQFSATYDAFLDMVHPDDREMDVAVIQRGAEHGESWDIEHRLICDDRTEKWVHAIGKAIKDDNGKVIELLGTVQDITKEKLIDLELEQSSRRFKAMFESITDAIVYADPERKIRMVNQAAIKLFGYEEDELQGNLTKMLYASYDEFKQQGIKHYNPNSKNETSTKVITYKCKNGNEFPGETLGVAVKSSAGEVLGYLGIIRDITERTLMESELESYRETLESQIEKRTSELVKARNDAERANKAKSEFLSSMSHELRTPLNAILGFGQMLELDESELSDIQNTNVKEILDAGHHLLNLINEVLNLAQIEAGKLEINMEKVNFTKVLQECMKLMSISIEGRNIEVIDNVSDHHYFINADFMRLKQIFLNLISNAVKYNKESGRLIFDSRLINNHRVRICVTDTGAGLTEEEVSRLFNPFERLNAEENIEGTGIGLTITKHLGQLMDLGIGVESTPGKGSTFWVELELVL